MTHAFYTPPTILTGAGAFNHLGHAASGIGSKCLIVTGVSSMQQQGFLDQAISALHAVGISSAVCQGVEHDPLVETVESIRSVLQEKSCDIVLGLGGGSSIDAAKAAAAFAATDMRVEEVFHGKEVPSSKIPIIAIPSTFGTGTEATPAAVITNPQTKTKKGLRAGCMLPRIAIVDPNLGMGMPASVQAASGMDALTQAIESYCSIHASDITEAMSFHATVLLHNGLLRCHQDPTDLDARSNCANGSLMAGIALCNARLGLVHGLAHPIGARYGLAHGWVCGILLPYALKYNKDSIPEKYALLGSVLGGDPVEVIREMLTTLGLPQGLGEANIPQDDFEGIAQAALPSGSTQANPRTVTSADLVEILEDACQ